MAKVAWKDSNTRSILLDILHATGMVLSSAGHLPSHAYMDRETYNRICAAYERKMARQTLQRMQEQKLLAVKELGERVRIELTPAGKCEVLKIHIRRKQALLPRGEYCLVSFDVPEATRHTREAFRNFLKEVKFERVHHSVWKTRRDVLVPLQELICNLKVERWVKVFRAREE